MRTSPGGPRPAARSLADPDTAPPMTLPGEILRRLHPELPYTIWQMTLDASGWGD
ncbi:hypothetical protein ACIBKX_21350 [Streptomyces sp. NPDC050658]|uniref:hypothetical protein n=1 Tax=unclassified Streptomyces TaxID=2593676 RepID=UPI00341F506B